MSVEIRRGSDRFVEREPGRLTRHAFSFGEHYDPARVAFGAMVCHDDHLLGRGQGFGEHHHEGLEIVTWVVSGTLVHTGADGEQVRLGAGQCAVLTAGAGTTHSEHAADDDAARFVQVWLRPDDAAAPPSYRTAATTAAPGDGLVAVAGAGTALPLDVAGARLAVVRTTAGETVTLPAAARVHAYLVSGALLRSSLAEPLSADRKSVV